MKTNNIFLCVSATLRLILFMLAAALVPSATLHAQQLSPDQKLAHDIYKELIEINTTDSSGSTTVAANAVAARLKAAGFADADVTAIGPNDRKGNLVARLHGR